MLEIIVTTCLFFGVTSLVYYHVGVGNILASYRLWFAEGYWVNYNVVEAVSWLAKAAVILPGLIWQKEIWQLHIITLFTSALLIWVSERKLLPTMVAFNTLWIGLSSVVMYETFSEHNVLSPAFTHSPSTMRTRPTTTESHSAIMRACCVRPIGMTTLNRILTFGMERYARPSVFGRQPHQRPLAAP